MNITKEMKKDAIDKAMQAIFEEPVNELLERTGKLAQKAYDARYGEDVRNLRAVKTNHDWLSHRNTGIRFENVHGGPDLNSPDHSFTRWRGNRRQLYTRNALYSPYSFDTALPFPPQGLYAHKPSKSELTLLQTYLTEINALCAREQKLETELEAFLQGCRTLKQVIAGWPEGERYFPGSAPKSLPIQIPKNVIAALKKVA